MKAYLLPARLTFDRAGLAYYGYVVVMKTVQYCFVEYTTNNPTGYDMAYCLERSIAELLRDRT